MLHTTTLLYMFRRIKTVYLTPISICLNVLSFSIWLLHRQCLGLFPLNNVSTGRRQEMLRCGRITKWHSCRLFTSNVIWQPQFRTSCSKLDLQTPSLAPRGEGGEVLNALTGNAGKEHPRREPVSNNEPGRQRTRRLHCHSVSRPPVALVLSRDITQVAGSR